MKIEGENRKWEDLFVAERWQKNFKIKEIKEKPNEWNIVLEEKEELLPEAARGKKVIQKGFVNEVEVLHFAVWNKPLYLKFKRRRWRDKKTEEDYVNQYEFHPKGMKLSQEFAEFLKKIDRKKATDLFHDWNSIRHLRKEDLSMVSRRIKWFHQLRRTNKTP